jgi:hypothetical protein
VNVAVVPAGIVVVWVLGVSVSPHAFHAKAVVTDGAMKTKTESTLNMTSEAFLWLDFIKSPRRDTLYIAYEVAIHRRGVQLHEVQPEIRR